MNLNDRIRLFLWHLSFVVFSYYAIHVIRRSVPTLTGEERYFPMEYLGDENALSELRINESTFFFNNIKFEPNPNYDLEIRILASNRQKKYLIQVLGYLLYELDKDPKGHAPIEICNVESFLFDELKDFQGKLPIRLLRRKHLSQQDYMSRIIEKETQDYFTCLRKPSKARFVLLLEDDALVVPEFLRMIQDVMRNLREEVDYVKLYHPTPLRKLPSVPIGICLSVIVVCILQCCFLRRFHVFMLIITSCIIFYQIRSYGPQLIADVRYGLTGSVYLSIPESCCTPAVLFRSDRIEDMANEMQKEESYVGHAKDHILDGSRFQGLLTDTNLVAHIGAFSYVRQRPIRLNEIDAVAQGINKGF